jgi:hypothetical protein
VAGTLVPVVGCPCCGESDLRSFSWVEEPLLRGGGYGEARVTVIKFCPGCGWEITAEVSGIRPQRRPRVTV